MYVYPAKLPGPKETSGTGKDPSVFSLFWHSIPCASFQRGTPHGRQMSYVLALISEPFTYPLCGLEGWLASIQSLSWDAEGWGADLCWQLAPCFILLIFGYIRGVREFLTFHFLLKIDRWCKQWKLSECAFSVNVIWCHLVLNSEAFFPLPCYYTV